MNLRHGLSGTPEYKVWKGMRDRCLRETGPDYHHYGGRGVTVCQRWEDFAAFYSDMGPRPTPAHSLDRIDNDGPYSPENCRWATRKEQILNRGLQRDVLRSDGARFESLVEASKATGISIAAIGNRTRGRVNGPTQDGFTWRLVDRHKPVAETRPFQKREKA